MLDAFLPKINEKYNALLEKSILNENVPPSPEKSAISINAKRMMKEYFKLSKNTLDPKLLAELRDLKKAQQISESNSNPTNPEESLKLSSSSNSSQENSNLSNQTPKSGSYNHKSNFKLKFEPFKRFAITLIFASLR